MECVLSYSGTFKTRCSVLPVVFCVSHENAGSCHALEARPHLSTL